MKKITLFLLLLFTINLSAQSVSILGGSSFNSIAEAITAATPGDVILVSGIHTESITIEKNITLRGSDPTTDIIQASSSPLADGSGTNVINVIRAVDTDVLSVTIENLGVRHGNASSSQNGGGINVDKITGLLTLKNLIVENNFTAKNGGGISLAGSNVDIIQCTIKNNLSSLDGGAIIAAPNNASGINNVINLKQSLIDSNTGRNGGGIYINGNPDFGNDFLIEFIVENTTISNNFAASSSSGNGGGAIFSASRPWTADNSIGNITLKLIHATVFSNSHASLLKSGLQFGTAKVTNFGAYNSIIVSTDAVATKAINFANTNLISIVNCIMGGLNAAPTFNSSDNNQTGKTATYAGLSGEFSNEGGNTSVLAISASSTADDFCTATTTGITLPSIDQRGYDREGIPDAGAYEFGGTLSADSQMVVPNVKVYPNPASELVYIEGVNQIDSIEVYSVLGVLEKIISGKNFLDISDLSSGVYLLIIKNNSSSITKRLIVK